MPGPAPAFPASGLEQPEQPLEAPVDFAAPAVEQTSTSQDSETNFYGQAVPEDETDRPQGR